ncbi:CheY-like chemotaxis protein [Catalinimonas alkaloidigena]|uniref:response regulator n=1 Tax=Catalinimonas alkaloidigena TaxID=1075417 RepID=UPI002405B3D4|nr:response regulator [Catalinimonas alkaloidigena]MDF9796839.1 CheY-like chemotaxis protein [Catalinimonas alkaloidigena]
MIKFNKVLLVDDDEVSNFITTEILNTINLADTILVASNGQEALDLIGQVTDDKAGQNDKDCPDLIFLDLNMPVMDGFEFLEACEPCNKNKLNVVVLTSSTNPKDIEETRKFSQVKGYLSKPLTADKVEKAIQNI